MAEACVALDYPVVSGNVSLYNETNGKGILPTPSIGGVGILADVNKTMTLAFKAAAETVILIGETRGHLGASLYLREVLGREEGAPPPVDLAAERRNGDFVRGLITSGQITACHDLSDGGLLPGLADMAMAGDVGVLVTNPTDIPAHCFFFGEDQGRYVLATSAPDAVFAAAKAAGVPALTIGQTGGSQLTVAGGNAISVKELRQLHEAWLPGFMAS
jgi:phosphoribosylformylglycinamidine synthase